MMTPSCRLGHKSLWPAVLLYIRSDGEERKRLGKSIKSAMERGEKELSEHFREIRNVLRGTFHRKSLNFVRRRKTKCNPKTDYKQ